MIRLLGSRVLLDAPDLGEREIGGIIIPAGQGEHLQDGFWLKCRGVGPDARDIEVGDEVFLPRFSGHKVTDEGQERIITTEADCSLVKKETDKV